MIVFKDKVITDDEGTSYAPFIDDTAGVVGLVCARHHESGQSPQVTYLYFKPSVSDDGGVSNVFVYMGSQGDPAFDQAFTHYAPWAV